MDFVKITQNQNHKILIKIRRDIDKRIREKLLNAKREKSKIKNKLTKSMILNYNLMIQDKRLGGKHII